MGATIRRQGFSLVEILLVIATIGILMALVIVSLVSSQGKALDSQAKSRSNGLSKALSQYEVDKRQYPVPTPNTVGGVLLNTLESYLVPDYLKSNTALTSDTTAKYVVTSDGKRYAQARALNNENEPAVNSGNGVYSAAAYSTPGLVAIPQDNVGALSLDGTDDYISVGATPNVSSLTSMSAGSWIIVNNTTATQHAISKGDLTYLRVAPSTFFRAQARIRWTDGVTTGSQLLNGTSTLTSGRWYHLAMTYDGPTRIFRLYVNGVQEAQATLAAGRSLANTSNLQFGRLASVSGSGYVNGKMGEIRLYDRALTADEIATWYSNGYGSNGNVSEANLIGLWSLADGAGVTAVDAKSVTGNGALTNFPASPWSERTRELLLTGIGSSATGKAFVTYGPQ